MIDKGSNEIYEGGRALKHREQNRHCDVIMGERVCSEDLYADGEKGDE